MKVISLLKLIIVVFASQSAHLRQRIIQASKSLESSYSRQSMDRSSYQATKGIPVLLFLSSHSGYRE
ncbi:hypothetical protein O6H91_07G078300 [Diphasiastrum complanatum]|uniref:Uncharacterized protein n=1 Tax=Diphasiastrum complanatum TaxID=34168 RepID=A0ACC2D770_DIPCM|nr:hypothetical protein O6H91_07G078300 [Diphasiastrum complanatum]